MQRGGGCKEPNANAGLLSGALPLDLAGADPNMLAAAAAAACSGAMAALAESAAAAAAAQQQVCMHSTVVVSLPSVELLTMHQPHLRQPWRLDSRKSFIYLQTNRRPPTEAESNLACVAPPCSGSSGGGSIRGRRPGS